MNRELAYQWVPGCRLKGDAQAIGEFLEGLRKSKGLTADTVLDAARNPKSVLHPYFNWNDTEAAEQYRKEQARGLIRSITVRVVEMESAAPVRAWAAIGTKEERYVGVVEAMSQPVLRQQLLDSALRELAAFQAKYQHLSELKELFLAAATVQKRAARKKAA